jgi:hypothetical protein
MLDRALVVAAFAVAACASSAPGSSMNGKNGSASPSPPQDTAMTNDRAPIYPADKLLTWLEHNKSDPAKLGGEIDLRIPVLVTLDPSKMNVKTATVGDKPDALAIKINDATLNIPIAGKLPMLYGEGTDTGLLWLRGLWRGGQAKEFQVTMVLSRANAADATFVEVTK